MFASFSFWVVSFLFLGVVLLLATTPLRPIAIFGLVAAVLFGTDILPLDSITHNYVNPSLLTLVALVLLSAVLEKVSFVAELSRRSVSAPGSIGTGVFRLGFVAGVISSFLNNTAVVATLMGGLRNQKALPASRFLLPLSYASIAGGMMTLVGTSTNLIVNSFVEQSGHTPLGFFDFTLIGLPVFLMTLVILAFVSHRFLPNHHGASQVESRRDYLFERVVLPGSGLAGKSIQDNRLRQLENMFLVEVLRGGKAFTPVAPDFVLNEGDVLVFSGDPACEHIFQEFDGLGVVGGNDHLMIDGAPLVEVVLSPSSSMIGYSLKSCEFRSRFDAAVIGIRRGNKNIRGKLGDHVLHSGDSLLLAIGTRFESLPDVRRDFITVSGIERRKPLSFYASGMVMAGFLAVVGLSVAGSVPLLKGVLLLLGACLVFRLVSFEELKARFPFELIVVVGGALGLSQAMFAVGLADMLAGGLNFAIGDMGPMAALIVVYLVTWLVTELVTNNAAAALMFPIAYAASEALGVSPYPFFMALAFGASASFLSPYGYQTNLMVYSAGNYQVKDYIKAGLPVLIGYSVVALLMIPIVFPF
jgi:di/tricarboxylate transporter